MVIALAGCVETATIPISAGTGVRPTRMLWNIKGGFYHDGHSATLGDVVNHDDANFGLGLTCAEKNELMEYWKSL